MKKEHIFSFLIFGAAGMYAYKKFSENPRAFGDYKQLSNGAEKLAHHISNNINTHPNLRPIVDSFTKNLSKSYINSKLNIRDVTPGA